MKITALEPQQKSRLFSVFIDGEYSFSADLGFIADEGIGIGYELTRDETESLCTRAGVRKAMRHGLYLLEHRDFTRAELTHRLTEKGYEPQYAEAAVEKLAQAGYIDDRRRAERMIEKSRSRFGKKRILYDMRKAGIPREDAEELISAQYDEDTDGTDAIISELERKLGGKRLEEGKELDRAFSGFVRRGYGFDTIKAAIEAYNEAKEE